MSTALRRQALYYSVSAVVTTVVWAMVGQSVDAVSGAGAVTRGRRTSGGSDGDEAGVVVGKNDLFATDGRARGQWEDATGVHCVSARMQIQPKFEPEMGPNERPSIYIGMLDRVFCPHGSEWTRTHEMRRRVESRPPDESWRWRVHGTPPSAYVR